MISNNNNRIKNKNKKNRKKKIVNLPRRISLVANQTSREIDAIAQIYAYNGLSGQFYSFANTGVVPSATLNMFYLMTTQLDEFNKMVSLYAAFKLTGISIEITRNGLGLNDINTFVSLPAIFLEPSLYAVSTPSVATQVKYAQSDHAIEIPTSKINATRFDISLPSSVVSKSLSINDIFSFGTDVWMLNLTSSGVVPAPEIFLNLGALATPVFKSAANTGFYPIFQVHIKGRFAFASPIIL